MSFEPDNKTFEQAVLDLLHEMVMELKLQNYMYKEVHELDMDLEDISHECD